MRLKASTLVLCVALFSLPALASDDKKDLTFSVFLDTYYGFDFNEPRGDRLFTTQAVRHNEFSINLTYIDVKLNKEKTRGRLALQAGTSVYSNYAGERLVNPQLADLMRHIQEAYAGYQVAEGLWVDAGIFLSHIGIESFISKDNWNYTRSLAADFSPYYQAGVRVGYQWNPQWFTCLHVLNGWQNIIETNSDKAVGMQIIYTPSDTLSFIYNNFFGREQDLRFFNNVILKTKLSEKWSVALSSDIGFQKRIGTSAAVWYVETLLTQCRLSKTVALGGRVEYFHDKDQIIVTTGTPNGFQTIGGSINVDWQPESYFLFRNEIRTLFSKDAVFSTGSGGKTSNFLLVTSVGLSF